MRLCTLRLVSTLRRRIPRNSALGKRQFSSESRKFLDTEGYVVIPNAVSHNLCDDLVKEIFQRAEQLFGISKDDGSTWSKIPSHGIVDIWHSPSLYTLRQDPNLYSMFSQLLGTEQLCVSLDKVCMKPPFSHQESMPFHTDVNYWTTNPEFAGFQGSVCLEDCYFGGGGFTCIPKFHKPDVISKYKSDYESGAFGKKYRPPAKTKKYVLFQDIEYANKHKVEVPMRKGDFLIWNSNLPHTTTANTRAKWRLQAYVRYIPLSGPFCGSDKGKWNLSYRNMIRECVEKGTRPSFYSTGNPVTSEFPVDVEAKIHSSVNLSQLGSRLFGFTQ